MKEEKDLFSLTLNECLAKTTKEGDKVLPGMNVETHCKIVGEIAKEIFKRYKRFLNIKLSPNQIGFLASIHDIGKVSTYFQRKIYEALTECPYQLTSKTKCQEDENVFGRHAGIAYSTIKNINANAAEIVGKHHGKKINNYKSPDADFFGGREWLKKRGKLISKLEKYFKVNLKRIKIKDKWIDCISGIISTADWLGSGEDFKNYKNWEKKIKQVVDYARLTVPTIKKNLTFKDIFSFDPYQMQISFKEVCEKPGLYFVEAPMGMGKTEAALYAAYQLMVKHHSRGIYFALPTQLTSNKIHERMQKFLDTILIPNKKEEEDDDNKVFLLHSNAWLKQILGEEDKEEEEWCTDSKRKLLPPFAVGTIDQALMSVFPIKYNFIRMFGLAGKVVVLDEIHSYDDYTSAFIEELIPNLLNLGCCVIILSATLTENKIKRLAQININKTPSEVSYPIIRYKKNNSILMKKAGSCKNYQVNLHWMDDTSEAINKAIEYASTGNQILFIANIVRDSQMIYKTITEIIKDKNLNIECGLLHSHFFKSDRERIENYWVDLYGKDRKNKRKEKGRILVGTQILEQSLDIDADVLFTQIAPIDMILQRIGRLWRHRDNDDIRPIKERNVYIISPSLKAIESNKGSFGKLGSFYSPYILYRTLLVLSKKSVLNIPDDIRYLLEKTYEKREETNELIKEYQEAYERRKEEERLHAQKYLSPETNETSEIRAKTRYERFQYTDVLLIKDIKLTQEGWELTLYNNLKYLLKENSTVRERREIATQLITYSIKIPEDYRLESDIPDGLLEYLNKYIYVNYIKVFKLDGQNKLINLTTNSPISTNTIAFLQYSEILGLWKEEKK